MCPSVPPDPLPVPVSLLTSTCPCVPPDTHVSLCLQVVASGPGLKGGCVGVPAPFSIATQGAGSGGLGLTVEGPCEAKIECQDNGDGSCAVSYLPTAPGEYHINILFAGRHIPGSPFTAAVTAPFDPAKVTASGPGLERGRAGEAAVFSVDCSQAGEAELTIEIRSEAGAKAEVLVQNNRDGTYAITYTPACAGAYTITINYGGLPVPNCPVRVTVDPAIDTSSVKVYGKGVEPRGEGGATQGLLAMSPPSLGWASPSHGDLLLPKGIPSPWAPHGQPFSCGGVSWAPHGHLSMGTSPLHGQPRGHGHSHGHQHVLSVGTPSNGGSPGHPQASLLPRPPCPRHYSGGPVVFLPLMGGSSGGARGVGWDPKGVPVPP